MRTRTLARALAAAFVLVAVAAGAQESAEWYREQADEAILAERYDRAVEILQEAQRHYDESAEFFMRLGDLYYDEELYELALAEYEQAEDIDPTAYEVLSAIAYTLGLLNREADSAATWSRLADLYPERIEPVQNLGWLLFKLHRLEEGVALLLDAWERFGPDADIAMTLGTLHAELYRFPESSRWYRRSIELARANESESFVAVAFYNLSLIEKLFHRYDAALESTERSLAILPRPTGYLARGELFELRMDFRAAHADYLRAYEIDEDTPLGRLNLALLYQRFGRLDEALAFATSVFEERDTSWLYYYGTDVRRHRMELHDILADIHEGLAETTKMRATGGPLGWVRKAWDVARHTVLGWYHRARFRDHASAVGEDVLAGGNLIDGNWYLYRANEGHPLGLRVPAPGARARSRRDSGGLAVLRDGGRAPRGRRRRAPAHRRPARLGLAAVVARRDAHRCARRPAPAAAGNPYARRGAPLRGQPGGAPRARDRAAGRAVGSGRSRLDASDRAQTALAIGLLAGGTRVGRATALRRRPLGGDHRDARRCWRGRHRERAGRRPLAECARGGGRRACRRALSR